MLANLSVAAMNLIILQGQWDLRTMWGNMSIIAKAVDEGYDVWVACCGESKNGAWIASGCVCR
jgi:hypothetical protein